AVVAAGDLPVAESESVEAWKHGENHPVMYGRGGYHPEVVSAASNPHTRQGRPGAPPWRHGTRDPTRGPVKVLHGRRRARRSPDPVAAPARPLNFFRQWRSQSAAPAELDRSTARWP